MTAVILIQHSRLYGRAPRQEMSVCVGAQTSLPLAGQMRNLRCESLRMKEMNTHTVPPSRMLNLPVRVPAGSIHDSSAGTRLLLVSVLGYTQAWFQAELTLPEPLLSTSSGWMMMVSFICSCRNKIGAKHHIPSGRYVFRV